MNDREKILKTLKDFGEVSTGRLAAIIGMNYYKATLLLQKMLEEEEIVERQGGISRFWRLKNE